MSIDAVILPAPSAPCTVRRLIIFGNPQKSGLEEVAAALARWAREQGARLELDRLLAPNLARIVAALDGAGSELDGVGWYDGDAPDRALQESGGEPGDTALLVCLGGDGTLIRAVHRFWPLAIPVLGVNLGSLGFNASTGPDQVIDALEAWRTGRTPITERLVLSVECRPARGGEPRRAIVVNEVVMKSCAHLVHVIMRQGEEVISAYNADGLIVSTPTGSTAWNLSAGGPIVHPALRAVVATAICPHTLASRPVVLPPSPEISLEFVPHHARDGAMLEVDGQEPWPVAQGDRIVLSEVERPLRLIGCPGTRFFSQLRHKLLWNLENTSALADLDSTESVI